LDESFRQNLNSNENIQTIDYIKDIKSKDETITQIINQYEDKMQRLSKENENTEKKIFFFQFCSLVGGRTQARGPALSRSRVDRD